MNSYILEKIYLNFGSYITDHKNTIFFMIILTIILSSSLNIRGKNHFAVLKELKIDKLFNVSQNFFQLYLYWYDRIFRQNKDRVYSKEEKEQKDNYNI